jgi:hypothetical protein
MAPRSSSESFTLCRWLYAPPDSLEEQNLATEAILQVAFNLLESLEEQCREEFQWRHQHMQDLQQQERTRRIWLRQQLQKCQEQQDQTEEQPEEQPEQQPEQQDHQEKEEQERPRHLGASQVLCPALASIQDDLIASPNHQASYIPSLTATAFAPLMPNLELPPTSTMPYHSEADGDQSFAVPPAPRSASLDDPEEDADILEEGYKTEGNPEYLEQG